MVWRMPGSASDRDFSMADLQEMFRRQERWQKERRLLPWPEKLRLAAAVRESLLQFRRLGRAPSDRVSASGKTIKPR